MADTKTIELSVPFEHHSKLITSLDLRQPTGGLYAELGEPRIAVRTGTGGYWVEQPEVIKRYLDRCITHQDGAALLGLMDLSDVITLKDELFGFFAAAEAKAMSRKLMSSSSDSKQ